MQWEFVKNMIFNKAKEQVMKASRGLYPAPLKVSIYFYTDKINISQKTMPLPCENRIVVSFRKKDINKRKYQITKPFLYILLNFVHETCKPTFMSAIKQINDKMIGISDS